MKKKFLALTLALALALSLAACGGKDAPAQSGTPEPPAASTPEDGETGAPAETEQDVDLAAFYNTLREGNTWPELMSLTEDETVTELLDSYYPGLSGISTKQCGVYIAAISAAVGEIALVEVESAEDVQAVEDIFQARVDYQVGDGTNPGGAWYPETIEGWKTKARIVSHGKYVMLAVGDAAEAAVESFEALFA
jgi:predicted small lipoprotein YifL